MSLIHIIIGPFCSNTWIFSDHNFIMFLYDFLRVKYLYFFLDPNKAKGMVVAVDLLTIQPIDGAVIINNSDFTHDATQKQILNHLGNHFVDLVMSDMAPNASGIQSMDHDNIMNLCTSALEFSKPVLRCGGAFLCKLWDGYRTGNLKSELGSVFETVKIIRPDASRKESAEIYLLAKGFHRQRTQWFFSVKISKIEIWYHEQLISTKWHTILPDENLVFKT